MTGALTATTDPAPTRSDEGSGGGPRGGGPAPADPSRRIDWRRLRSPLVAVALACSAIAALGTTSGTVIAGRLAQDPSTALV